MTEIIFETEEEMWKDFELSLWNLFTLSPTPLNRYMQIHCYIYKHCTGSQSYSNKTKFNEEAVNSEVYTRVKNFLQNYVLTTCQGAGPLTDKDLLSFYTQKWHNYKYSINKLNGICSYVNRVWIRREKQAGRINVHEIPTLSKIMWRDFLLLPLEERIISAVLKLIEQDRLEGLTNSVLVSKTIQSLVELFTDVNNFESNTENEIDLSFYKLHFENIFIETTTKFYIEQSSHFLINHSLTEYMKKAKEWLEQEMKRVETCLHPSTRELLEKTCVEILIEKCMPAIQPELKNLLDTGIEKDLSTMHLLLSKVPNGFGELKTILDNRIENEGVSAIENCADAAANDPNLYVTTIFTVYQKYRSLIQNCFNNDIAFLTVLDKASSRFINRNAVTKVFYSRRSSELLAKYCNFHLKMNSNITKAELEIALNQAVTLFKYLDDKDIFLTFYSQLFANRLINQTSTNDEAEAWMIRKLTQACGFEYTSKILRMFKDMRLSKELDDKFRRYLMNSGNSFDMDFNVQVLSSGFWPLKVTDMTIPDELQKSVQIFGDFYDGQFKGRKLQWIYGLSKGELHTTCFTQKYIFEVSTLQMSVLMMFNTRLSYTVEQLAEGTTKCEELLIQLLEMLLKAKLLLCDEGVDLKLTSVITLNTDYKNKKLKVNINMLLKIEQQAEQANTEKHIEEDRNMAIQAAIVKVMKTRKIMKHQKLLFEVVNQVNRQFTPEISAIKKAIEMLVEKEYLKRDATKIDVLKYVV